MALFRNTYRIESARLENHNYDNGIYFVTICAGNKIPYFGKIKNKRMILSKVGKLVEQYWQGIPIHFQNVKLDEFVIMPDHMHGVVIINCRDAINRVCTHESKPNRVCTHESKPSRVCAEIENMGCVPKYKNPMVNKNSLPAIIRSFKAICSREINKKYPNLYFGWHPRFYDVVIRNSRDLQRVRCYIKNNPKRWK